MPLLRKELFLRLWAVLKDGALRTIKVGKSLQGLKADAFGRWSHDEFNEKTHSLPLLIPAARKRVSTILEGLVNGIRTREALLSLRVKGVNIAMAGTLLGLYAVYSSPEGGFVFWFGLLLSLLCGVSLTGRSATIAPGQLNDSLRAREQRAPHGRLLGHVVRHSALYGWIGFGVIAGFMVVSQLYRLGDQYMWLDEVYSFLPARFISEGGEPVYPRTGSSYYRAEVYHRVVAWFMESLGVSRYAARLPNVFFNVGTLTIIYLFGTRISRPVGLAAAVYWAIIPYVLSMTHQVRMYPMFWFLFALAAYLFYRAIVDPPRSVPRLQFGQWDVSFHVLYLLPFVPIYLLSIQTQKLSGILLFGVLLFFVVEFVVSANRRRSLLAIIVVVVLLFLAAYREAGTFNWYQAFIREAAPSFQRATPPEFSNVTEPLQSGVLLWFTFPLAAATALHPRNSLVRYIGSIAVAGVVFLGVHYAQSTRYLLVVFPFLSLALIVSIRALWLNRSSVVLRLISVAFVASVAIGHVPLFGEQFTAAYTSNLYAGAETRYRKWFDYIELFADNETTLLGGRHLSYTMVSEGVEPDISVRGHRRYGFERIEPPDLQRIPLPNAIYGFRTDDDRILPYVEQADGGNRFWPHPEFQDPRVYITGHAELTHQQSEEE